MTLPRGVSTRMAASLFSDERWACETADYRNRRIGPYQIIDELGRGGMSAVYLAENVDSAVEQQVALKVLNTSFADEELLNRFARERQILATLHHPNIAALLDSGVTGHGIPYFVMEYIEGVRIDRFCDDGKLSVDERLTLFLEVVAAVEYAHRNHVVHRDLKPGNILVGPLGEVKLLDFGIAKMLAPNRELRDNFVTRTGDRMLTPQYASPEQITGEAVTVASDVYQLGLILYELLTGQLALPTRAQWPTATTDQKDPILPSRAVTLAADSARFCEFRCSNPQTLKRKLSGDLDNIICKALARAPVERYASVGELGADLQRYLRGKPVRARKPSRHVEGCGSYAVMPWPHLPVSLPV